LLSLETIRKNVRHCWSSTAGLVRSAQGYKFKESNDRFYFTVRMSVRGGLQLSIEKGVTIAQNPALPHCSMKLYTKNKGDDLLISLGILAESQDEFGRKPPLPEDRELWTTEQVEGLPQLLRQVLEHKDYKGKRVMVEECPYPIVTNNAHFYDDDDESMDSELDPENIHLPLQREIFDEVIKRIKSELRFAKTKNGFQTYYVYEPPEAAKKKSVATRKLIVIRLIIYLINI
jgi:hypothetical protein